MLATAGDLADVVDVIGHGLQRDAGVVHRLAVPERRQHPVVERGADHPAARGQRPDLIVVQLPVVIAQRAAAVVGSQHRAAESLQRLPERLLGQMADVQQDSLPFHRLQHGAAALGQAARRLRPVRVGADAVVNQADDAQPLVPPLADLLGTDDRVRPLHGQHEADRCLLRVPLPLREMGIESGAVTDLAQEAARLHPPVVGQLAHRLGIGDVLGPHAGEPLAHRGQPALHGDEDQSHPAAAQLLEADHPGPPALAVHAGLRLPDRRDALRQVAVPFERVEGDVQMRIDDQHEFGPPVRRVAAVQASHISRHRSADARQGATIRPWLTSPCTTSPSNTAT